MIQARVLNPTTGSLQLFPVPISRFCCTILAYPAQKKPTAPDSTKDLGFFNKPATSAFQLENNGKVPIPVRFGPMYHEIEICVLIGDTPLPCPIEGFKDKSKPNQGFDPVAVKKSIAGIGLGIDWTLKEMIFGAGGLREKMWPWARAKAFDRAAAVTHFVSSSAAFGSGGGGGGDEGTDPASLPGFKFSLAKNGAVVTSGNTDMLEFDILTQIWEMHKVARLNPGDVVMTGTPTIGDCAVGDVLNLKCDQLGIDYTVTVCDEEEYIKATSKI